MECSYKMGTEKRLRTMMKAWQGATVGEGAGVDTSAGEDVSSSVRFIR
jgi:hypothetical protein